MLKKVVSVVSGLALASTLIVVSGGSVSADESIANAGSSRTSVSGDFETAEGLSNYVQAEKVSGPSRVNKKFVQYLTPAWARVVIYNWENNHCERESERTYRTH